MAASRKKSSGGNTSSLTKLLRRWFLVAPSAMAMAMFVTLALGTWLEMLGKIPVLHFLTEYGTAATAVIGAACGVAIALGLKAAPLTAVANAVVGAFAFGKGGCLCAFAACVAAAEIGNLTAGKTKLDLLTVPLLTLIPGILLTTVIDTPINTAVDGISNFLMKAAEMKPFVTGLILAVFAGLFSVFPLGATAITLSLGLTGIAGGAVCAGCCAFMATLAAASVRENGFTGVITIGFGTPMLETPAILRRPQILIPCVIASAVAGPLSTAVLKMSAGAEGALGLCGIAGPISTYTAMIEGGNTVGYTLFCILAVQILIPVLVGAGLTAAFYKAGWLNRSDLKILRVDM